MYKTKLVLALEMITHQIEIGTKFDYVAGDGLCGNNYALIEALDKKGITAIFTKISISTQSRQCCLCQYKKVIRVEKHRE